jgi:hypothetical protein
MMSERVASEQGNTATAPNGPAMDPGMDLAHAGDRPAVDLDADTDVRDHVISLQAAAVPVRGAAVAAHFRS